MQSTTTQNHSLTFSQGSDSYSYRASVNYINQNGYNLKENSKTYSFNLSPQFKITPKLDLNISSNLTYTNGTVAPVSTESIYRLKPYELLVDSNDVSAAN